MGCKYPNLIHEINSSRVSLCTLADHARVTESIMSDFLNGKGDIAFDESMGLYNLFKSYKIHKDRFDYDYLFSKKSEYATKEENERLIEFAEYAIPILEEEQLKEYQKRDLEKLKNRFAIFKEKTSSGFLAMYSEYRHIMHDLWLLYSIVYGEKLRRSEPLRGEDQCLS